MGWKKAATSVEVHWIPDVHREMMHGTNALGFARTLQSCIDRANISERASIVVFDNAPGPVQPTTADPASLALDSAAR